MKRCVKSLTFTIALWSWILGVSVVGAIAQPARIYSIQGQGKVKIKRQHRTNWELAMVGKEIKNGDQIFPSKRMKVWVSCPNHRDPVRVRAGVASGISSICINLAIRRGAAGDPLNEPAGSLQETVTRDERGAHLDPESLGGFDSNLPYLIAPRHTLLITQKPLLHWNPVPGISEYTLEVNSPKGTLWQTKTKQNRILYAGPTLEAGIPYSVIIRINNGKSSLDEITPDGKKSTHLEFRLLRPTETPKIANPIPSDLPDLLALVDLYSNYALPESLLPSYQLPRDYAETYTLTGEAIALLESVIQKGQSTPLIHRTLGDLYWQTGLINPAETEYKKVIALAKTPESLEDATLAQEQLGQIYGVMGRKAEAQQAYLQAKEGYQTLGDKSKIQELQTQLERLKP
jgi:tetratricopeptide (TPR) repeat protein